MDRRPTPPFSKAKAIRWDKESPAKILKDLNDMAEQIRLDALKNPEPHPEFMSPELSIMWAEIYREVAFEHLLSAKTAKKAAEYWGNMVDYTNYIALLREYVTA